MILVHVFIAIGVLSGVGKASSNAKEDKWTSYPEEDVQQNDPLFKSLGCFRDHRQQRALRNHFLTATSGSTKDVTTECAREAVARGFVFFGVQNGVECWGDKEGHSRYDMHGSTSGCRNGLGSSLENSIYQITKVDGYCVTHVKLIRYNSVINETPCQSCTCHSNGNFVCLRKKCPALPHKCERIVHRPGVCCPFCACFSKGVVHKEGSEWSWPINDRGCEQCSCTKGQAKCLMEVCPTCNTYVDKPGQCCRACASEPDFTIKPTQVPVLTFPPPPPGVGDW